MAAFVKGDIVVLPFPFSDLSASKRRPALVLADLPGEDIVLCQITSKNISDGFAVSLDNGDLLTGNLPLASNIRPNRLFTADKKLIAYTLGSISQSKYQQVVEVIVKLIEL